MSKQKTGQSRPKVHPHDFECTSGGEHRPQRQSNVHRAMCGSIVPISRPSANAYTRTTTRGPLLSPVICPLLYASGGC